MLSCFVVDCLVNKLLSYKLLRCKLAIMEQSPFVLVKLGVGFVGTHEIRKKEFIVSTNFMKNKKISVHL